MSLSFEKFDCHLKPKFLFHLLLFEKNKFNVFSITLFFFEKCECILCLKMMFLG